MSKISLKQVKAEFDIDFIEDNPQTFAENSSINKLETFIKYANYFYHSTDKELVSDYAYDVVKDVLFKRDPENKILTDIGAPLSANKEKVPLPYWMGSMSKIKPGDGNLARWTKVYPGPYIISDKLDGISGLITYNHENSPKIAIYSRGEGNVGGTLHHLASYIKLPDLGYKNIAVRGEFVIDKAKFIHLKKHNKTVTYKNPRSFVSGVLNHKTIYPGLLKLIDFVAYELINPWLKPGQQFSKLKEYGFNTVHNQNVNTLSEEFLKKLI